LFRNSISTWFRFWCKNSTAMNSSPGKNLPKDAVRQRKPNPTLKWNGFPLTRLPAILMFWIQTPRSRLIAASLKNCLWGMKS